MIWLKFLQRSIVNKINNLIKLLSSKDDKNIKLGLTIINQNQDICIDVLLLLKDKIILYEWCEHLDICEDNSYKIKLYSGQESIYKMYQTGWWNNTFKVYCNETVIGTFNLQWTMN